MKAIIVGAGIAGITTALGLQKLGIEFDLLESSASLNANGAGIWLAPNALKILEKLNPDLLQEIKSNGSKVEQFGVTDHKGSPISLIEMKDIEKELGHRHVTIHRKRLIEILSSYLIKPIAFNKAYHSHKKHANHLSVTCKDGSLVKGDFIIACDGVGSKVRQKNFAPVRERISGQTCWRAIIDHKVPKDYKGCFYEMWDIKNSTRVGHAPISDEQIYIFITAKEKKNISNGKITKDYLSRIVRDYSFDITKAIKSSNEEDWLCHELSDFKPLKKWYSNEVVLVGDSAHAMTPNMGQGGNQAIESAYCIGLQLNKEATFYGAFRSYQALRKARVDGIINRSWKLGQFVNMPWGVFKKTLLWLMKKTPNTLVLKQSIKQYTPSVE